MTHKPKRQVPLPPSLEAQLQDREQHDLEAAAAEARQARARECEAEVRRVLEKFHCRLATVQQIVDGQPGPVLIHVLPLEGPRPGQM